jgi:hypothetical protein
VPIESATYIADLNSSNPPHTDQLSESDDHLRLTKAVLLASFPNVNAAVTDTAAVMNGYTGRLDGHDTDLAGKLENTGPDTFTGDLTVAGNLTVSGTLSAVPDIPTNTIWMWFGTAATVPAGWAICDGTGGTPDLTGRFPLGATIDGDLGVTGGAQSPTLSSDGAHDHGAATGSGGAHSHGGSSGNTTLSIAQMPAHSHQEGSHLKDVAAAGETSRTGTGGDRPGSYSSGQAAVFDTESTGGGGSHDHSISSEAAHTHTITAASTHTHTIADARPPFAQVYFIMKT